jgi:hypothetical protein
VATLFFSPTRSPDGMYFGVGIKKTADLCGFCSKDFRSFDFSVAKTFVFLRPQI